MTTKVKNSIYADTGCDISPKCLECPMRECRHDNPGEYRRYKHDIQDTAVLAKMRQDGLTRRETAAEFGLSLRTVYRIAARSRAR